MLVDTSVWVDHFRRGNADLIFQLEQREVWCHPFVLGELACGNLSRRKEVLSLLETLPRGPEARHSEVLALIEGNRLMGRGLGWTDVHLLASARLASIPLWTLDKRLAAMAREVGVSPRRS